LKNNDWKVIRFSDKGVEDDVEAVEIQIAKTLELKYEYTKRTRSRSGNRKT